MSEQDNTQKDHWETLTQQQKMDVLAPFILTEAFLLEALERNRGKAFEHIFEEKLKDARANGGWTFAF